MLDKRLQIGGLQVGGPRTAQNPSRFRVANNVHQTSEGVMVPRFHGKQHLIGFTSNPPRAISAHKYNGLPFVFCATSARRLIPYHDSVTEIPCATMPIVTGSGNALGARGIQTVEKLGCLFANIPEAGLFKYDGVQMYRAGVPLPRGFCTEAGGTPDVYVRVIQHHLDFQGNIVNSGYEDFSADAVISGPDNVVHIRMDKGGGFGTFGSNQTEDRVELANGYDAYYFRETSQDTNVGAKEITVTTGGDHNVVNGVYLITNAVKQTSAIVISGNTYYVEACAYKVKRFTATTVVLDMSNVKVLLDTYAWAEIDTTVTGIDMYQLSVANPGGTNYWASIWTSNAATGNYVIKRVLPVYYESIVDSTTTVIVTAPTTPATLYYEGAFNLSGNLGDIYDVTTVKTPFPWYNGSTPNSLADFSDMALISYENEVYYSDTTLGGAFEMTNGLAFAAIGEHDDGAVQSICGNSDFLVVSRKFKNYYVSGNLVTANYRVQEIGKTSLGAYSNESTLAYGDKILLVNRTGVFAIYSGGRCDEVSENIKGFFENYSGTTTYSEEAYFNSLKSFPTHASLTSVTDQWLRLRADTARGLIAFITKGDGQGKILILNMNNGEFYTWNGLNEGYGVAPYDLKDMVFIDGDYYVTKNDSGFAALYKEDKTLFPYAYFSSSYAPELEATWFTAGEPSLEKKITQYKLWGKVTGTIEMGYYKDWDSSALTTADSYINSTATLFSHKIRLPTSNVQATSIRMKLNTTKFEIEGMELEFSPFQQGMKR